MGGSYIMKEQTWLTELFTDFKDDPAYITEHSILDFTEKLELKMKELKVTRAELARRLGVSKPFVTKLFNGNPNMTIKTMVSILHALDCRLYLDMYHKDFELARRPIFAYTNKNYKAFYPATEEVLNACAA